VWQTGSNNTFARWPNRTGWPNAWDLQAGKNTTHAVPYYIPSGWTTNLVTHIWQLGRTNTLGEPLYGGDYWYQGSKRVLYSELTIENGSYVVPGVPDGRFNASNAYFDDVSNERHYWSLYPTNITVTYNTTFRVWGNFTTYVTHLSNHQPTLDCHTSDVPCNDTANATLHAGGRWEAGNIMQCPFQFRCFTPEAAAGGPACHRRFPEDFQDFSDQPNGQSHAREFKQHCQRILLTI
jgi:hypothetical protein